ncbi:helix-turn-helix transcriptional regulator [Miniphocaeibacter halophilus]|uniref:Helix-turn-helix transcriptional regulator n=1 Tax=Miniphocaeibacter halophilus TaxID=2931922 RepID=A0AC61MMC6_9FIRM|nr:response regulator transcription factor [Miniphocaeibacter halophilus]QQK06907.1 helix-turn-helix transcriptional regulator [Miniphocaeibacter halophilus]
MNNIDISLVNINNTDKDFIHYCQEKMDCFLVIKGFVTIGVNNEEYILKENDIIVTNNGDRYYLVGNESNIVIKMTIDIDYLSEIYSEIRSYTFLCNPKDEKISSGNKYVNLKSSISKILYINLEKKKGYKFELFSQFFDFIKYLLINFGIKNRQINEIIKADKDFSNIKKYISCNYNKTITLTDLAKKNYISPQYFSKLFKSKIGIGFHKYITNIRIDNSIQDLLFTDETIVNVALKNGFPSSKSFSTNFKDRYKLTPTEYRLKNQDKIKYSEFEVKEFNPSSTDTIMELKRYIKKYELFKTEMNPKNDLDMIKINLDLDSKEYLDVPTPIINILNIDFLENDITIQQLKYVKDKFNVKYVYFSAFDDIKIENVLGHSPLKLYGIYKYLDPLYIQKLYPFFKIDFSNVYFKVLKGLFTLKEYYEYLEQSLNSIVKIFPLYYISDFKFEITNDSFVNQKDYIDFYNNCYRIIKKSLGEVSIGIKTFYNRFEPSKKEIIELLEKICK